MRLSPTRTGRKLDVHLEVRSDTLWLYMAKEVLPQEVIHARATRDDK